MDISKGMLDHYIGYITVFYFNDHELPPDEITDYYNNVLELKSDAIRRGDLDPLRLGIDYLLCNTDINLDSHGGIYPYDDDEVREILRYIRSVIWPDLSNVNCEEIKDIKLVNTNRFDWWEMRKLEGFSVT
ncbi:MAG: hypothetical protein ACFBSE_18475 [Prochloraceae cyanobacterium]